MSGSPAVDSVRRLLENAIAAGRMPGAAWRVERDGELLSAGQVGEACRQPAPQPLLTETPWDLASLTKPLCTALLLVLLEADGVVDPDAPIGQTLTPLRGRPLGSATPLQLATHTAGLPPWRPLYLAASNLDGYLSAIAAESLDVASGRPVYSDLGYIVLGALLERAAGVSLAELFERRIAHPLDLGRIGFAVGGRRFDDAAATEQGNRHERSMAAPRGVDHDWREGMIRGAVHDANAWTLGGVAGHAGLFGTADAVLALLRELLQPRVAGLDPCGVRRLLEPAEPAGDRTVGMVLARAAAAARGVLPGVAPGHTGFTGTSFWLEPEKNGIYLLLTNRVHPTVEPRSFDLVRRAFHRVCCRA